MYHICLFIHWLTFGLFPLLGYHVYCLLLILHHHFSSEDLHFPSTAPVLQNLDCICLVFYIFCLLSGLQSPSGEVTHLFGEMNWWDSWCKAVFSRLSQVILLSFSSVQSLSHVRLFVTPWTAACQAPLPITNSRSPLKLTSIELLIRSSHLILCHPLLLLPPIPPSITVFSNESTPHEMAKVLELQF